MPRTASALADHIRLVTIEQSKRANVGHIGSSLSVADILGALFAEVLAIPSADDAERDRFILSKGHAALALYAALNGVGRLTDEELDTYCGDLSVLGSHPEHRLEGIDFSTGSLGQGIPIASGAALAARLQGSRRRAFVLASDAECNEGSVWEAAMFAAHHRLSSLVVIVDRNGQQALGYTRDVLDLSLEAQWRAFGWDVHDVDGHDVTALVDTVLGLDTVSGPPHVLVARTTFGNGVSFMEGQIKWHYLPMTDSEHARALEELATIGAA
jgi:transketolase